MLERTIAPVLADCQAALRESLPEPRIKSFGKGPASPAVSVVIPLYRVYDFLRVQVSAFAADRWFTEKAELIYVLDSPEHEGEVAHLLGGLFLAYGLPMQLVVMGRNGGFSAACNAGAAASRGQALAMVNSDVIPDGRWLAAGAAAAARPHRRTGAVGPKLLYDDGSLQHAGLYFKRDSKGTWLNHHYFKGMPSSYAPANVERPVPGRHRRLHRDAAGAVHGDRRLRRRLRHRRLRGQRSLPQDRPGRARHRLRPERPLYHLERQSISKSLDYTRGVASQHNSWLQTRRWDGEIEALMAAIDKPAPQQLVPRRVVSPEPEFFLSRANLRRATAA
jgi:hypothetical protein